MGARLTEDTELSNTSEGVAQLNKSTVAVILLVLLGRHPAGRGTPHMFCRGTQLCCLLGWEWGARSQLLGKPWGWAILVLESCRHSAACTACCCSFCSHQCPWCPHFKHLQKIWLLKPGRFLKLLLIWYGLPVGQHRSPRCSLLVGRERQIWDFSREIERMQTYFGKQMLPLIKQKTSSSPPLHNQPKESQNRLCWTSGCKQD